MTLQEIEHQLLNLSLSDKAEIVQSLTKTSLCISDEDVLAFATDDNRAVITLNRQDFIRLHRTNSQHFGIIVCTNDTDRRRMATRINEALAAQESLKGKLIRIVRPAS